MYGNYGSGSRGGGYGGSRGGGMGQSFAPVKVGEELEVTIEAVGEKGDGIAKKDGFVLFVPGVKQGDVVKIRVTKVLRKVGFAEVVGAGTPGAESAEPSEGASEETTEAPAEQASEEPAEDSESFGDESEEQA